MKPSIASALFLAATAAATAQASTCTVHVYPTAGVYPMPGSYKRMFSFNGADAVCIWQFGEYDMQTNRWNDLECAGDQASCKLSNWYGSDMVTANLPCNTYWIQSGPKKFCEAAADPRTGKPYYYGQGAPLCKESLVDVPSSVLH